VESGRSPAPFHPALKVKRKGNKEVKARRTYEMVGCGSEHIYRAFNSDINALERALKERMLFYKDPNGEYKPVLTPCKEAFTTEAEHFLRQFEILSTWTHPTTMDDFVRSFSGQKRRRYEIAAENIKKGMKVLTGVKMFLKFETYNLTLKPNAKPRGIYPRSDEFLVEYGRRIKAIEKKIFGVLEEMFGYKCVFKGLNQEARGKLLSSYWGEFSDPVAVSADASAFEASVSVDALRFTHGVYNRLIRGDKQFKKLQRQTLNNIVRARTQDGSLQCRLPGGKMSGDPDTACGNCLVSAFMLLKFFNENDITKHRSCIDGDDVVIIVERRDLEKITANGKAFYARHGFNMVFENPVFELELISFCQSQPIWTPDGYRMVRNVKSAVAKDAFSRKDLSSKTNYLRWIASIGECGLATCGGIPVLQEYYQQFLRNSNGAKVFEKEALMDDYRSFKVQGMNRKYEEVHPSTRYSFYIAFGITPDEQLAIEGYYSTLSLKHGLTAANVRPTATLPW
jgi:hypothetical protein